MNWTDFFTAILILYLLWYSFNMIKDLILNKRKPTPSNRYKHYNIENLIGDEEKVVNIREGDFTINDLQEDQMNSSNNLTDAQLQEDQSQFITFKEPPENQGIPLQEFLKMARDKAVQSANKIQYS